MGEENTAYDSLSEHTKKLDIALYYAQGDMEKAKQIVAGTVKDVYVIKLKFSSTTIYGAVIIFFQKPLNILNNVYLILSQSFNVMDFKTGEAWQNFESDIETQLTKGEHDSVLIRQFKDKMVAGFTVQFAAELKELLEGNDGIAATRLFSNLIHSGMNFQNVQATVDWEEITSLDMELHSSSSKKIDALELRRRQEERDKQEEPEIEADDEEAEVLKGKEIKLILRGRLVLSPIKGKDIGMLKMGDRIKIAIMDSHSKAIQVLKAFNAYEDGEPKPIIGRIISTRHMMDGGYKIFAIVAKGIFVRIDEEEETIKVALDPATYQVEEEGTAMRNVILIIVLFAVLAAMIATIIAFVI